MSDIVKGLELVPKTVPQGDALTIRGVGWGGCPVQVRIDGSPRPGIHIARGFGSSLKRVSPKRSPLEL
jgi:hypothetical protein